MFWSDVTRSIVRHVTWQRRQSKYSLDARPSRTSAVTNRRRIAKYRSTKNREWLLNDRKALSVWLLLLEGVANLLTSIDDGRHATTYMVSCGWIWQVTRQYTHIKLLVYKQAVISSMVGSIHGLGLFRRKFNLKRINTMPVFVTWQLANFGGF